jgi:hypothetical protein
LARRLDTSVDPPVLTIFSAPKGFHGHIGIIQQNAIRSWLSLSPQPKVILFGNEDGMDDVARELNVQHMTAVETNAFGTPLLSYMFRQADAMAAGELMAFVSADIVLTQAGVDAARIAMEWSPHFLLVAQRHDVEVRELMEFDPGWEQRWAKDAVDHGKLHSPGAIDWFVYPRGQYQSLPPFAIGRTSYDNWLLWKTVASGTPLIDATPFVTLIHQNHDYSHVKAVDVWNGPEALENRKWIEHWTHYYAITHATWTLGADGKVVPASGWKYRIARPRQALSHTLRASRRIRTRLRSWRLARRYGL